MHKILAKQRIDNLLYNCSLCVCQWVGGLSSNKMNAGYFSLVATVMKPQQIPMFLHVSEQKGYMLKLQYSISQNACASQIAHTWKACL